MSSQLIEENNKLKSDLKNLKKQMFKLKIEYDIQQDHIKRIINLNNKLNPQFGLQEISKVLFNFLNQIFSFEKGTLLLKKNEMNLEYQKDFRNNKFSYNFFKDIDFPYKYILKKSSSQYKTFILKNFEGEENLIPLTNFNSCMITPLRYENEMLGVIILENMKEDVFSKNEENLIDELVENIPRIIVHSLIFSKTLELPMKDQLTDLYNKNYFFSILKEEIIRLKRHERAFSILFANIDEFENINKDYGKSYCDKILKKIADKLKLLIRGCDVIAHYENDKFIFMLPNTDFKTAEIIAKRIKTEIKKDKIIDLNISLNFGIKEYNSNKEKTINDLINEINNTFNKNKI